MSKPSVLFVCLGNICRSPLAEGIYRHVSGASDDDDSIASAGLGGWHAGDPPDPRSIHVARRHGIDIARQRARQVSLDDFRRYERILAMDRSNLARLTALAPEDGTARVELFSEACHGTQQDVPDPYYGGDAGFLEVYTMLLAGCEALAESTGRDTAS